MASVNSCLLFLSLSRIWICFFSHSSLLKLPLSISFVLICIVVESDPRAQWTAVHPPAERIANLAVPTGAHVHNSWSLGKLPFSTVMDFKSILPRSCYNGNGKLWLQNSHVVLVYSLQKYPLVQQLLVLTKPQHFLLYLGRVPTRPGKPGKMRVHMENLEISWNFEKFNKYHGKMTWSLEKLGGY